LDLLEGVLIDLLKTKWNTFVKAKFYQQFYLFAVYFFISLFAFLLRPRAFSDDDDEDASKSGNGTQTDMNVNDTTNAPVKSLFIHNLTEILCNYSATYAESEMSMVNSSTTDTNSTLPIDDDDSDEWTPISECPLLDISTLESRVSCELPNVKFTSDHYFFFLSSLDKAER
jgi:hypothetical protein